MLTRTYLTVPHRLAGEQLVDWMKDAGMQADFDNAGNVVGRYEGREPGLPALLVCSHFDTVCNAGQYDGVYGVLAGIACIKELNESNERLPFAIEIIAFGDEEGVRFNVTLIGSRIVAGTFDNKLLSTRDNAGISIADALRAYGKDPLKIAEIARKPSEVLAYIELHIEQGPVLLGENLPVGIVSSIAGASRFAVEVVGTGGHAGTVPMSERRDAATAASEALLFVEQRCSIADDLVGTVGNISVPNGVVNVIPGRAEFCLDVRAGTDAARDDAVADILKHFDDIAERRKVKFVVNRMHDAPSATCSDWLNNQLSKSITRAGVRTRSLLSGAGHDAMSFAALTDIAILFIRCGNCGVSHHPDETMTAADAELAAIVLLDFIRHFEPQPLS